MNSTRLEGFIEVSGSIPILLTALHCVGAEKCEEFLKTTTVDLYTGEIAYKVGVVTKAWVLLSTVSRVDVLDKVEMPDANLNMDYARVSPFWHRAKEIVSRFEKGVVLDIHGMKGARNRPDVCIGSNHFLTASKELAHVIQKVASTHQLTTSLDDPFKGGSFIRSFQSFRKVESLAIEIDRNHRCFGDEKVLKFLIDLVLSLKRNYL